jgi:hypothetical protein
VLDVLPGCVGIHLWLEMAAPNNIIHHGLKYLSMSGPNPEE